MDLTAVMSRLGLGKNAPKVYGALLASKRQLLVAEVAAAAGIDRPEVYRNLKKLLAYKFVKKTNSGKRVRYLAENPRRIDEAFKNAGKEAASLTEKLAKRKEKELPDAVRYFKGFAGIREVFDDVVTRTPPKATFYRYTSERDLRAVNKYLSPEYRAKRDTKKLERLVISNPASGKQKRSRLERFIKFFPPEADLFDHNIIQLVYADSVAFINLNIEEAFIIRDQALAKFQAAIFKQLYKKL